MTSVKKSDKDRVIIFDTTLRVVEIWDVGSFWLEFMLEF